MHLCLGAPGIAQGDHDRYAAHLLNVALGGGMSSRLFQEIRERQGKAYTVYSFLTAYRDSGYAGVYVGTSAAVDARGHGERPGRARRVAPRRAHARRSSRASKTQMKGSMLLGLETSDSRMSRIAKNEIYYGRDVPIARGRRRRRRRHQRRRRVASPSGSSARACSSLTVLGDVTATQARRGAPRRDDATGRARAGRARAD